VLERRTGRVLISAHNHGFAVDAPLDEVTDTEFGRVQVGFVCLNDDVVEGLECLDVPAFSVQFHPEAAAGPHDAQSLFDRFVALMADPDQHVDAVSAGSIGRLEA
jgi:carbamoyl-phosphate synthase small subunit